MNEILLPDDHPAHLGTDLEQVFAGGPELRKEIGGFGDAHGTKELGLGTDAKAKQFQRLQVQHAEADEHRNPPESARPSERVRLP
jgi:hypothetical protein